MITKWQKIGWLPGALAVLCVLAGCPKDAEEKVYVTGTATGQATGGTDQPLYVKVTMEAGALTGVVITGEDYNSYGKPVMEGAPANILQSQDFESWFASSKDVVSGATVTRSAIRKAGNSAVSKIRAGQFDPQ